MLFQIMFQRIADSDILVLNFFVKEFNFLDLIIKNI